MTSYTMEESEFQRPRIGTQTLIIPTSQLLFQSFYFLSINQVCHHILSCEIFNLLHYIYCQAQGQVQGELRLNS